MSMASTICKIVCIYISLNSLFHVLAIMLAIALITFFLFRDTEGGSGKNFVAAFLIIIDLGHAIFFVMRLEAVCFITGHTLAPNVIESPTRWLHGFIFRRDFEMIKDSSYKSCSRDYLYICRQ